MPDFLFNFEATESVSETVTQIAHDLINLQSYYFSTAGSQNMCKVFSLIPSNDNLPPEKTDKISVYFSIFL